MAILAAFSDRVKRLFSSPLESRIYVDLIYKKTSRFANFNPAEPFRLGDYGRVCKKTGVFIRDGNIFELDALKSLASAEDPEGTPEGKVQCYSYGSKRNKAHQAGVNAAAVSHAGGRAGVNVKSAKERHVTLMVQDPILVKMRWTPEIREKLTPYLHLKGKAIVTQYTKCTTYTILFSNANAGQASLTANVNAPVHIAATAGGNLSCSEAWNISEGSWRTGEYEAGNYRYFPLLTLHTLSKNVLFDAYDGRDAASGFPIDIDFEAWELPWDLDEEGYDMGEEDEGDMSQWPGVE